MSGFKELKEDQSSAPSVKTQSGMKKRKLLTQERVRELFNYDPETGIVTRRLPIYAGKNLNRIVCNKGDNVGSNTLNGYLETCVDSCRLLVHRLIFLYVEGFLPEQDIDHINGNKQDNKWCNLRLVSRSCNMLNTPNNISNTSGVKGVSLYKKSRAMVWETYIGINNKRYRLGYYDDFIEAVAHRLSVEQCLGVCSINSPAYQYMQKYLNGDLDDKISD